MRLTDFARTLMERRGASKLYAETFVARAQRLANHVGRDEIPACLTEESVNRFLSLLAESVKPVTVKGWRGDLLGIWRAAADDGLCPYPIPRRIRRVKVPPQLIECYSIDEARELLTAAGSLRGVYPTGLARRDYWEAVLRVAWDTGLRRADCWRFGPQCVDSELRWRIVQRKTGRVAAGVLHESTHLAIVATGPLAWPHLPNAFRRQFEVLKRRAGVRRGSFKWLRRASGSHVEAANPGCGHLHLGHADAGTFRRHYDAGLAPAAWAPPEL